MKICFLSNAMTPHQYPISRSFFEICDEFSFVETLQVNKESLPDGWKSLRSESYIVSAEHCLDGKIIEKITDADAVITGAAPDSMFLSRLKAGKLTFRYSERFYKDGFQIKKYLRNAVAAWLHHGRFQKYPLYMLCASAYTSADCTKFGNYSGRCYKWGYFPETRKYENIEELIHRKDPVRIIWVARLIDWKHPEYAVEVARRLKQESIDFHLDFIGTGELSNSVERSARQEDLTDCVSFLGSMTPEQVRDQMEDARILLFTSDFREGWGAVLNEAMNSGCAVVASHAIGSVPFLLKNGENGLIFESGDVDELYEKVKTLLQNPEETERLGKNAYQTIVETWNAEVAAERFACLTEAILSGDKSPDLFDEGPCSRADVLPDNWYRKAEI